MTEPYALTAFGVAASTRIESAANERPFTAGKNVPSDDCWKLFSGTVTAVVATTFPFASYSVRPAFTGSAVRFTRPMFVRKFASDSMPVRSSVEVASSPLTFGTDWPYVPMAPVVNVRLVTRMAGVVVALEASIAIAPAPLESPKRSLSAFAYVIDWFTPRKRLRVSTGAPPPGMNVNWPLAGSLPPLKSVSSVRQTEPPTPFVAAAAGTSERYAVGGRIVTTCEAVDDDVAFETVSDTPYEPCVAYACAGFCAFDVEPSPKFHSQDVGEPVD